MSSFAFDGPLQRVVFASGAVSRIAEEVRALGVSRAMLVCGGNTRRSRLFETVRTELGTLCAEVFDRVVEHSDALMVTQGAEIAGNAGIDALVAVGGGSASDTAKAIAILLGNGGPLERHAARFTPPDRFEPKPIPGPKLPVIAIPTTASAAEVTPGLGIRDPATGKKLLFWDVSLASRVIILDPVANVEVPAALMASTAMNAFAHCAEGLYSRVRNPISEGLARQGARILARGIPAMVAAPDDPRHRGDVLVGANLSGMVISNARVGIHHAVCHSLGALGGLPHGVANSIMLPHALAYNIDVAAPELRGLAEALGVARDGMSDAAAAEAAVNAVAALQQSSKVPQRLRDTSLDRALLPAIAEQTLGDRGLYFNPKPTHSAEPILRLLEQAW